MNISNKQIGYLTLLFIALALGAGGLSIWNKSRHTHHQIKVIFEEIGSLKPETPVVSQGVRVGQVTKVSRENKNSIVVIDFSEPREVKKGTLIFNRNFSLVGERYVSIEFSKQGEPYKKDDLIEGVYEKGFSESLHLIELAVKEVAWVQSVLAPQLTSTDSSKAFYIKFRDLLANMEGIVKKIDGLAKTSAPLIERTISQGNQLAKATTQISEEIDGHLQTLGEQSKPLVSNVSASLTQLTKTFSTLESQLETTTSHPLYKDHLEGKELLEKVRRGLETTKVALLAIKTGGANLEGPSKLGLKNFYFFRETAREKRKRRLEEAN